MTHAFMVQRAPEMPETIIEINHLHFDSYSVRKKKRKAAEPLPKDGTIRGLAMRLDQV